MAHPPKRTAKSWTDRLLDFLATRLAVAGSLAGLALFAWYSFGLVTEGESSIRTAQARLQGPTVRGNAMAITDISRLRNSLASHLGQDGLTPEGQQVFETALDFLFVRTEYFRSSLTADIAHPSGEHALAAMENIIALSDAALANDFADSGNYIAALDEEIETAMAMLTHYMNVRNTQQLNAVNGSLDALERLTGFQVLLMAAMGAFSIGILGLLRREVLNRRLRAEAEERALFLAFYDSLTGLPNRSQFTDDLTEAMGQSNRPKGPPSILIFIDIDDFKDFNDVYGYLAGDQLLCQMAEGFKSLVALHNGLAARVAGDEFALLLPYADNRDLTNILQEVGRVCQPSVELAGTQAVATCSIGVATTDKVALSLDICARNMRQAADFAQSVAKSRIGRGEIVSFDEDLAVRMNQKKIRSAALCDALECDGIDVWFQPKVSLDGFTLTGFEALARWNFEGTMIPPSEFIALAEENGLISRLDLYMLRNSVAHLADWNRRTGRSDQVSVNFSAQHISMTSVASEIAEVLGATGVPPQLLTIELTETVEVSDWSLVGARLQEIIDLGCHLSVDDFGSGYSSLGYLRNIPAHELKIDRSLVQDIESSPQARSILSAVVEIADTMGFETVIEGIETEGQARIAVELGCDLGQGYLFSRPVPICDLPDPRSIPARFTALNATARRA